MEKILLIPLLRLRDEAENKKTLLIESLSGFMSKLTVP